MGITREDLTNERFTEQDRAEMKVAVDAYMKNDEWVQKTFKKVGILLTGHPGSRPYMRASIDSHKKLGYWICLTYDNYIDPEHPTVDYNAIMPTKHVMDNVDTFLIPHHQTWGGVLYPYFWQLKWGINVLQDFEYIYCSNADCIIEKPEGFEKLFEMMGDADFMSCGPVTDRSMNTTGFIAKTKALKQVMLHFEKHFIPFENYEKYTQDFGNAEGRLFRAIKDLKLDIAKVVPPLHDQIPSPGQGTWFDILGFRHIHYEHNYAYRYKGIPPETKYFDPQFMGGEYEIIKAYWETKDMKVLENWWAKE